MIQLEDETNFGCQLRDGIKHALYVTKELNKSTLRDKLAKIDIPEQYWNDIIQMTNYRKYDRTTDWVEQLLEQVVHRQILEKIINEETIKNEN